MPRVKYYYIVRQQQYLLIVLIIECEVLAHFNNVLIQVVLRVYS